MKKKASNLNALIEQLEKNEQQRQQEREKEIQEKFNLMKQTWANHEMNVENTIREICKKNQIEYLDKEKVPFKGKPDNTITICDEYFIFDAKSPASEDLQNFPNYINLQKESVKKYIKEENVRKDIFLVVPSNTIEKIKQFTYNLADYNVYVVTIDSLEPIILSLKKIEDYKFIEQLSPEDRDDICRIIGKFAHHTKRRIQIDQFFQDEFLSLLNKCKAELPNEILKKVIEFENAEKLNPPQEKRVKQILTSDLEKESKRIKKEAEAKNILFPSFDIIKNLPLSNEDEQ